MKKASSSEEASKVNWKARLKKRRGKSFHPGTIRELNLVAMMDMMTVVLIFLLKSYSVSALSIPVGDEIHVPTSTNTVVPQEVLKLTVTRASKGVPGVIALDEERVIELTEKKLNELEGRAKGRTFLIKELADKMTKRAESMKAIAKMNPKMPFEGKIMIIADKDTPYWLITEVLFTSAESQFEQYNLVAMRAVQD